MVAEAIAAEVRELRMKGVPALEIAEYLELEIGEEALDELCTV